MSTVQAVGSALETQLAAVSTTLIKDVLSGVGRSNSGFPYVRVFWDGPTSEQVTGGGGTASDYWTEMDFIVEIIGEIASDKTAAKQEADLRAAGEGVLAKLEEEYKLNTSDIITSISSQGSRQEQVAEGLVRIVSLKVSIRTFRSYT